MSRAIGHTSVVSSAQQQSCVLQPVVPVSLAVNTAAGQGCRWCGFEELLLVFAGSGVPGPLPGGGGGAAQTGAEDFRAEQRRALYRSERIQEGQDGAQGEWA